MEDMNDDYYADVEASFIEVYAIVKGKMALQQKKKQCSTLLESGLILLDLVAYDAV